MSVDENKGIKGEPKLWLLGVILLAVVGLLVANGSWLYGKDPTTRGTFGDMFGGVNALFSGLAFSVLAFTLLLQRFELKLQREELAETRKVMEAQREQMELQAKTQQLQQFENTFFQLIKGHGDIVANMRVPRTSVQGRNCFNHFINLLDDRYTNLKAHPTERIEFALNQLYENYESELGHYFRHLYHMLKFIDEHKNVDRRRYRSFLRAQLSADEFVLLFYNCLGHRGAKCKPLVEKYGMLKHLPPTRLLDVSHADYFDKGAFTPTEGSLD